jgi:hypothetical protein
MLTDTKPPPRGSRTPSFLSKFSPSFVHLHLLHSIPVTGTPELASAIQNIDITLKACAVSNGAAWALLDRRLNALSART